ncbi:MAG: hypothetical protein UY92_C0004G0042 [Candidatus Magasanikbacteria bacterium GW2011_GWA2_56_11]|uniref:GerMN domain-containing protein n=1 Tax=Candidatus Magasanikbacteria bacterium GW2011_GWA2_56_11 TaxID=1619044 RepID=A0A0G1YHJ9_9BACT|nr:MAG: hypothetical protein UY92_C0004G0042 [Candidatus Magasanikbacteria bacterium GW2011_GWA2_56_11]
MKNAVLYSLVGVGLALTLVIFWAARERAQKIPAVSTFAECAAAGYPVAESYPRQCRTPDGRVLAEDVPELLSVVVDAPRPNELVASPVTVSGQVPGTWFFEANLPLKITDSSGKTLGIGYATAEGEWMTEKLVRFSSQVAFESPSAATSTGFVVVMKDNPSGLSENEAEYRVPVRFAPRAPAGDTTLRVYFGNSQLLGPGQDDCATVFPVERRVSSTLAVARAAVQELLQGPTAQEKAAGYTSSLNPGAQVQKLVISFGQAYIDFDEQLQFQVGGSCRVAAIRAQIRETLKQFPSVEDVVISIDGRTEDILQP